MDLVDIAENAFGLLSPTPLIEREVRGDLILVDQDGPVQFRMALRNRFEAAAVDERIAEVRSWFAERGRDDFTWMVGTRSTPADLGERLVEHGAAREADGQEVVAMVLTEEPAAVAGVELRVVETFEDALVSRGLLASAFGIPPELVTSDEELSRSWRETQADGAARTFLAFVDGTAVGRATCVATEPGPLQLLGGSVMPAYRGRGVYRALVRARWDEAVRRGTPALVTQAGRMSKPILERLGFRQVGRVQMLVDRTGR